MSWNIFDAIEAVFDLLNLLDSPSWRKEQKSKKIKSSKYKLEWTSAGLIFTGSVLLFFIFKEPLPVQYPFQTLFVGILIGIFIASLCCFVMHILTVFYFRSLFSMIFFCVSLILFSSASVLFLYFKSGLFL